VTSATWNNACAQVGRASVDVVTAIVLAAPGAAILASTSVRGPRRRPDRMADVSAIVVTYEAFPWIERCLASVRGYETVVVDHGSTDGTVELVCERFPEAILVRQPNRGLAAGWNAGMRRASGRYFLALNADAWVVGEAVGRLVAFADAHPDAAVVGPRLLNPDGTLQPSARSFPTLWRLATEFLFLRRLAPRTRALNAFYMAGFDHQTEREVDWIMGACMLVRRGAVEEVGAVDEGYFLFSEEVDWCYRFARAGWKTLFYPSAEVVHVLGAAHGGQLFRELVRGHLRYFTKFHGALAAERARKIMLAGTRARALVYRGERVVVYRDTARWLASGPAATLLESGAARLSPPRDGPSSHSP
jgi:N-acetylglucosaminyl-diphospho-decaprenol L-rhamnosyltransferase